MTKDTKIEIRELLIAFCECYDSQAKAAKALKDVSAATISQIRNNNWDLIADSMWLSIGKQVGFKSTEWVIVETENYQTMYDVLSDAKQNSRCHAIVGRSSWGKDTGIKGFKKANRNVLHVNCSDIMTTGDVLSELLVQAGEIPSGRAYKLQAKLISKVNRMNKPIIVLNENEKLKSSPFNFFITLFNSFEDRAGIVLSGTMALKQRILNGIQAGKPGYDEFYSRIGGKFIELEQPSKRDIRMICNANGVTDAESVSEIYNEFLNVGGDQRRVKKLVENKQKLQEQAA